MSTILLVSILLLINAPSQVCGINHDPILYEACHEALISNNSNLIQLQSVIYPPRGDAPVSVRVSILSSKFTVNNITLAQNDAYSAFEKCSSGYCSLKNYYYIVSNDVSTSSHDRLKQYIHQQVIDIDYTSLFIFNKVTFSNIRDDYYYNYIDYDNGIELTLNIPQLHSMPSKNDVDATLSLILSWVSVAVFI